MQKEKKTHKHRHGAKVNVNSIEGCNIKLKHRAQPKCHTGDRTETSNIHLTKKEVN